MPLNIKNAEVERLAAEVSRLTGESKTEAIRRALEEHILAFLVKPVEPEQLGAMVLVAWTRFQELAALTHANTTLQQTLQNRKIIERAKGILMKRHRWSEPEAFRRLQRGAMNRRTTMIHLAQEILDGNELNL